MEDSTYNIHLSHDEITRANTSVDWTTWINFNKWDINNEWANTKFAAQAQKSDGREDLELIQRYKRGRRIKLISTQRIST